jgi:hypothetical protein
MKRNRLFVRWCSAFLACVLICFTSRAQDKSYVLKGTVVTPTKVIANGSVLVVGNKIKMVGPDVAVPQGTPIVDTGGIILPGFIDLHNHLTWNLFPRWKPGRLFANRYEWQQIPAYGVALSTPHAKLYTDNLGCQMNRYAEVKAITQGETSVVGTLSPAQKCIEGLARNLDFYSGFYAPGSIGIEKLRYEIFPLELDAPTTTQINLALDNHDLTSFIVHLAEGSPTDASSAREFKMFAARGFLRGGVSIIHGVALKDADFHQMATNSVGLIWSPRSNIELYGATTDVASAAKEHVKIALSPDWSPSGSDGMMDELVYAATWNAGQKPPLFSDENLFRMATEIPAQLAGVGDKIGAVSAGYFADLIVIDGMGPAKDAYYSAAHSHPVNLRLVVIDGEPVYGSPGLMATLLPSQALETIDICGTPKAISFDSEYRLQGSAPPSWQQTLHELRGALSEWGAALAPLDECLE